MLIRNMKNTDYNAVDKLMKQVHGLHVKNRPDMYTKLEHPYSENEFQQLLKNDRVISVLAEENNNIVGICFATIKDKSGMVDKTVVYMDDLCIDKNHRGQGIGKKLFSYISDKAKEMGAKRLDLMVWSFNKRALNFYEELGMKPQRYIFEKEL